VTWLLVEDDGDIRNVVAIMMTVWGEKPLAFPDGTSAWAWLDSVASGSYPGELPSLALMDIRMPGYTGDKLAARIRQTDSLKNIPIILMTAFSLTEAEINAMREQSGIDHLINKPLPDMDVFKSTIYRIRDERKLKNVPLSPVPGVAQPATLPVVAVALVAPSLVAPNVVAPISSSAVPPKKDS